MKLWGSLKSQLSSRVASSKDSSRKNSKEHGRRENSKDGPARIPSTPREGDAPNECPSSDEDSGDLVAPGGYVNISPLTEHGAGHHSRPPSGGPPPQSSSQSATKQPQAKPKPQPTPQPKAKLPLLAAAAAGLDGVGGSVGGSVGGGGVGGGVAPHVAGMVGSAAAGGAAAGVGGVGTGTGAVGATTAGAPENSGVQLLLATQQSRQQVDAYLKLKETIASARPCSFEETASQRHKIAALQGIDPKLLAAIPELLPDVPPEMMDRFFRLGVIPPETPAPMAMLQRLWKVPSEEAAMEVAEHLGSFNVLRTAELGDGTTWCLMRADHMEVALLLSAEQQPVYHNELLASYCTGPKGQLPLRSVKDDGYIMQNVAHHLVVTDRLDELAELLMEPAWIEAKLHAYGISAIVQDFRRFLGKREDLGVKLLLQAFMLSLGYCMQHPTANMLRQQMLARLMRVSADAKAPEWLREWCERQTALVAGEEVFASGLNAVHLMPRSATLEQAGGLHRMTLSRHTGPVRRVVISPNGREVFTASEDGSAQVWDMNVGDCVMQLARDGPLTDVAVAPDGQLSVVASIDGHCSVWDMESGEVCHVLKGHAKRVNKVVIDRQGIRCVTASDDGTARVWSIADGTCEQVLVGHGGGAGGEGMVLDVAISADGCMAASVSDDLMCRVWDLEEEECKHVLEGHSGWVVSVEFVGTSSDIITASHDQTARVWDGERGRCWHVLTGHRGRLNKVAVAAGGSRAVTCSDDMTARVWDVDTGDCVAELKGHSAWVSDAAITRDSARVVTVAGDGVGIVWDVASKAVTHVLRGHSEAISCVVLTNLGGYAVTASDDGTVRVWDTKAPPFEKVDKHEGRVNSVRTLPDGRHVVSVAEDGIMMVWDAGVGRAIHTCSGHDDAPVAYLGTAVKGHTALSGSADRRLCLWDTENGTLVKELPPLQGSRVKAMAFDGSCSIAAMLLFDSTVVLVDVHSGTVRELVTRRDVSVLSSGPVGVEVAPRGRFVLASSKDGTTRVWDCASGALTRVIGAPGGDAVLCTAISPDEAIIATASASKAVLLSRATDGVSLAVLQQPGGAPPETAATAGPGSGAVMAFSPDGQLLAVTLDVVTVAVWDMGAGAGQRPLVLPPPAGEITGMVFSPVGHILAVWGLDCTLRLWCCGEAAMGEQLAFFMADGAITSVCFVGGTVPEATVRGAAQKAAAPLEECVADIVAMGDAGGRVHFVSLPRELQMAALF
ncbi:hypothetical protein FOA52_012359 [Chlamydomonas sp. UWO 241]|nr:hypothetical protein FOA52_012359 [Chlamydomonas sp. UWO 241]